MATKDQPMIVSLYQSNPRFGKLAENLDEVLTAVKPHKFDLLVLPELFATGYLFSDFNQAFLLAEEAGKGYVFETIRMLAAEKNGLVIYGFPERRGKRLFNSSLAVFPNGQYLLYQKSHLFDTEKEIFSPGETGFSVFSFRGARIGMMICFDWRFPEAARKLTLLGAQIVCHPSNLVLTHCPDAMITRALENAVFTITANRIGEEIRGEKKLRFIGKSRIISPDGKVLAQVDSHQTGFIASEINPELADNKRVTENNDLLADRRPELY